MTRRRGVGQGSTLLLTGLAALAGLALGLLVRVFHVRSHSMAPTLHADDVVLGVRSLSAPPRASLVALAGHSVWRLKRLVGLPGDAVALRGRQLFRNRYPVHEPAVRYARGGILDLPATVLGPEQVVALGDNRDASLDSRQLGAFPLASVRYRLVLRLWPPARAGWLE